jgi:hypothetical protein
LGRQAGGGPSRVTGSRLCRQAGCGRFWIDRDLS